MKLRKEPSSPPSTAARDGRRPVKATAGSFGDRFSTSRYGREHEPVVGLRLSVGSPPVKRAMLGAALAVALVTIAGLVHQDRPQKAATGARLAIGGPLPASSGFAGIHTIKHVVVIMQENRSFDPYFGTFPGADGIPMQNGQSDRVRPGPAPDRCIRAVPRPERPQRRRPARALDAMRRHRRRQDGRLRREASRGRIRASASARRARVLRAQAGPPDVDGLPRRSRDPELLDVRAALRPPGPHVRAEPRLEPARAPVHGLRLVGALHDRDTTR